MNATTASEMFFCRACAKPIHQSAATCPGCGAKQQSIESSASDKRILPAILLCFFVGMLGIHRIYVGKVGTGILQLLTLGGLGTWVIVDCIYIVTGAFTDKDGNKITQWT